MQEAKGIADQLANIDSVLGCMKLFLANHTKFAEAFPALNMKDTGVMTLFTGAQ